MQPENTGKIQVRGRFSKGQSGNPAGKPKGARHQSTLLAERLFAGEIQSICEAVIAKAKTGDVQAAKIVLDRLFPPRRDNPVMIDFPKLESGADLLKAVECITSAVGRGDLSPSEGESLARIVDTQAKVLELAEFERRLLALEQDKE